MDTAYQKFNNESAETTASAVIPPPGPPSAPKVNGFGEDDMKNKRVRLRVVENESDYFLKLMNVRTLRRLTLIQIITSTIIFVCQILLYATDDYHKVLSYIGIAIWGPLLFFSLAGGLSWLSTKKPSGCIIGTSLGFQITSAAIACITVLLTIISLVVTGRSYSYSREVYDAQIFSRVLYCILVVCAGVILVLGIFISIQFCRVTCCAKLKINECIILDIEATK